MSKVVFLVADSSVITNNTNGILSTEPKTAPKLHQIWPKHTFPQKREEKKEEVRQIEGGNEEDRGSKSKREQEEKEEERKSKGEGRLRKIILIVQAILKPTQPSLLPVA